MKKWGSLLLLIFVLLNFILVNVCLCSEEETTGSGNSAASEISKSGTTILNAIAWFGYAIALGMIVFIGIKYMLGAADAKANMKSAITGWLIGAFLVFGVSIVISIVTGAIGGQNTASEIINAARGL